MLSNTAIEPVEYPYVLTLDFTHCARETGPAMVQITSRPNHFIDSLEMPKVSPPLEDPLNETAQNDFQLD